MIWPSPAALLFKILLRSVLRPASSSASGSLARPTMPVAISDSLRTASLWTKRSISGNSSQ
eukprot:7571007-Pyramimonas_sp.AAC.1